MREVLAALPRVLAAPLSSSSRCNHGALHICLHRRMPSKVAYFMCDLVCSWALFLKAGSCADLRWHQQRTAQRTRPPSPKQHESHSGTQTCFLPLERSRRAMLAQWIQLCSRHMDEPCKPRPSACLKAGVGALCFGKGACSSCSCLFGSKVFSRLERVPLRCAKTRFALRVQKCNNGVMQRRRVESVMTAPVYFRTQVYDEPLRSSRAGCHSRITPMNFGPGPVELM